MMFVSDSPLALHFNRDLHIKLKSSTALFPTSGGVSNPIRFARLYTRFNAMRGDRPIFLKHGVEDQKKWNCKIEATRRFHSASHHHHVTK